MSSEASRAAFEAWYHNHFFSHPEKMAGNAWQASREVALEEAISAIESANADRLIYVQDCVQIIEDLK